MDLLIGTRAGLFRLGDEVEELVGGARINHVTTADGTWWAVDDRGTVHSNGSVVAEMPDGVIPMCIEPTPEMVWIGADKARLFGIDRGKLVEDEFFAAAPGRDSWYTPWGDPADIRSMTLDADHTLYINVHVGGILRYDNTGLIPTLDIDSDVHQVAAHPIRKGAVFAACALGVASTHNGHDFDIRADGLHASYCRAISVLADSLLVSASTGPRTSRGRIYRGGLWEGGFEPVTSGLPEWFEGNVDTHCLVSTSDGVFAGFDQTVWRSGDNGDTWEVVAADLPQVTCLA